MYLNKFTSKSSNVFKILFIVIFSNCSQTENGGVENKLFETEFQNVITSESLKVCWNPPNEKADSVANYELGYRTSGNSSWIVIKQAIPPQNSPYAIVYRNEVDIEDSIFYFAVRLVAKNGLKSDFHSSSDIDADPPDWRVLWK